MDKVPPTFYHETVLLKEAVDGLAIVPNGVYVDCTYGGGGHSREILSRLQENGKLIAFDQDEDAWRNRLQDERLIGVHENFRYLSRFLRLHGFAQVDGILADLGVSSHHFDTAQRGFSTRFTGPLDMRMDNRIEQTAAHLILEMNEQQLQDMFSAYGEVRNARQLAKHIVTNRGKGKLLTTDAFKQMIATVVKGPEQKYFAQVFQALRIAVNEEMYVLEELLKQSLQCLKTGGRMSIITFHSLEDRIVKQFFKAGTTEEDPLKGNRRRPLWKLVTSTPITPSEEEQKRNNRARSAKLRIAEKL